MPITSSRFVMRILFPLSIRTQNRSSFLCGNAQKANYPGGNAGGPPLPRIGYTLQYAYKPIGGKASSHTCAPAHRPTGREPHRSGTRTSRLKA
jgi:hypothetical protein